MKITILVLAAFLIGSLAWAGHELTFYPSFYPQEVTVRWVEPRAAAPLLAKDTLLAYVGAGPLPGRSRRRRFATWSRSVAGWS